jgi:hypothetical protein
MKWLLYIIAIVWIGAGSALILYTQQGRDFVKKVLAGADKGLVSIFPIAIGAILIVGAFQTAFPWIVVMLGILSAGKGCVFLFNPGKLADKLTSWYLEQASDHTYRLTGIIAVILGTALLSWL